MRRKKSLPALIVFAILSAISLFISQQGDGSEEKAIVTRVVDGDTMVVMLKGMERKVRLLGVDTPEKDGPYTRAEPMNREASMRAAELAQGQAVTLTYGGATLTDKYDRLLAYVTLPDGRVLNEILIQEGLAEAIHKFKYTEKAKYHLLEARAKSACAGLWRYRPPCSGKGKYR
ncbi:MAG: thermonuclease family protein [Nitrospinae bacterium]|nr:thermonuclease family protein [Nitrospinota bacterium]